MPNPISISSNEFWGRRYGTYNESWGNHFPKVGFGSKGSNSGKGANSAASLQSKADKKAYEAFVKDHGRPVIYIGSSNRRDREKEKSYQKPYSRRH